MRRDDLEAAVWVNMWSGLIGLLAIGCATAKVSVTTTSDYSPTNHYRKVSMLRPGDDPRKVMPKVSAHLRALGMEVDIVERAAHEDRQGTGFFITDEGLILTCAHGYEYQPLATVWVAGSKYYADVVRVDTNMDIALLKPQSPVTNKFQRLTIVSDVKPWMGQDVYTLGFPLSDILGKAPRLTKGLISSTVGYQDNTNELQVSAAIQPGNSGSPLLDEKGNVLGMISATLNPRKIYAATDGRALPQNVNFAVKSEALLDFLKQANVTVPTGSAGPAPAVAPFERAKDGVVLIRSGKALATEEYAGELWCRIRYVYYWMGYPRFRQLSLDFFDAGTGDLILRAWLDEGHTANETEVIDALFAKIGEKLK